MNQQRDPQHPSQAATRERMAFVIIILFTMFSLIAVFIPDTGATQYIVPLIANMLTLVVRYYFNQGEHGG
jgi:uncharacterized membrane protein